MYMCTYHGLVYDALHYLEAVQLEAERSMLASVTEVQALSHYALNGEVHITQSRHILLLVIVLFLGL